MLLLGYSDFSFDLKALEKLYIAKTSEEGIIQKRILRAKKSNKEKVRFKMFKYPPSADVPKEIVDQYYPI